MMRSGFSPPSDQVSNHYSLNSIEKGQLVKL